MTTKIPRIFILEGGNSTQSKGWRHYQIVTDGEIGNVLSRPLTADVARTKYKAKFFPRGTWEDESKPVPADTMPVPKLEILKEIYPENPEIEKRQLAFA